MSEELELNDEEQQGEQEVIEQNDVLDAEAELADHLAE
jgi:hypothetical protein